MSGDQQAFGVGEATFGSFTEAVEFPACRLGERREPDIEENGFRQR